MELLLGPLGYIASSVGFIVLFLLLLTTYKKKSLQKQLLLIVCLVGVSWAITTTIQLVNQTSVLPSLITETLFYLSLSFLLISTLSATRSFSSLLTAKPHSYIIYLTAIIAVGEISRLAIPFLHQKVFFFLHLIQAIACLWLVEQLYRRSNRVELKAIKPLCIGVGLISGYNFALYADALLTNAITPAFWQGRGWVITAAIPLIVITTRRLRNWESRVYVSRDIIYHSTLILVAGSYLLLMSLAGYYIKAIGNDWAETAQTLFFALGGLVLASLFLSDVFRQKVKVFIAKHFFANKYEYREEWMHFCSEIEDQTRTPYDNALSAMMRPFGCEYGILAIQKNGQLLPETSLHCPIDHPEASPLLQALGKNTIEHQWIVDLPQLCHGHEKPPFNVDIAPLCTHQAFTLLVPLISSSGTQGVFLLSKPTSTDLLNWEDRDLMNAISVQLSVYLTMYETNQKLAESQQFDTFNRMSAFLVHDLKNVVAQLQLLSRNAEKHRDNPEFIDDAFDTVDSAVSRLNKVLTQLSKKRIEADTQTTFEIAQVIEEICQSRSVQAPKPEFHNFSRHPLNLVAVKERFQNSLNHLIQNAQEATKDEGSVVVSLVDTPKSIQIMIKDTGQGMSASFIKHRLFKPFDTTKGNAGMGVGAYDAKVMAEQLGGFINVESTPNEGSCFTVQIPKQTTLAQKSFTILK
ncbi:XrtA/PEP-CTERM system histidine kinase PrsK [Photobacterium sanctipauli]|uniref:XrtA/PEP-CTERM system histidine kinase PrsK n=1 Tax=Photobacterium sanctipauli TaxID=1342794 RepID=UPI0013047E69|nr:XrtA/PEP-CTERM system histidine kinase PrsK [Photobacterium sanctipauli]